MPRIAILGGGLCGRLTALQLAEQGLSVASLTKGGAKANTPPLMLPPPCSHLLRKRSKLRLKSSNWADRAFRCGATYEVV